MCYYYLILPFLYNLLILLGFAVPAIEPRASYMLASVSLLNCPAHLIGLARNSIGLHVE